MSDVNPFLGLDLSDLAPAQPAQADNPFLGLDLSDLAPAPPDPPKRPSEDLESQAELAEPTPEGDELSQLKDNRARTLFEYANLVEFGEEAREASILGMQERSGAKAHIVRDNFDEFQKSVRVAEFDAARWRRDNPDLYQLFIEDPDTAISMLKSQEVNTARQALRVAGAFVESMFDPPTHHDFFKDMVSEGKRRDADLPGSEASRTEVGLPSTLSGGGAVMDKWRQVRQGSEAAKMGLSQFMLDYKALRAESALNELRSETEVSKGVQLGGLTPIEFEPLDPNDPQFQAKVKELEQAKRDADHAAFEGEVELRDLEIAIGPKKFYNTGVLGESGVISAEALGSQVDIVQALGVGGGVGFAAGYAAARARGAGHGKALETGKRLGGILGKVLGTANSARVETGSLYQELRNARDSQGNPVRKEVAMVAAIMGGIAKSGLELASLGPMFRAFGVGSGAAMKASLADPAKSVFWSKLGKDWLSHSLAEAGEEAGQTGIDFFAEYGARVVSSGQPQDIDLAAGFDQIGTAAGVGGVAGGWMGGGGAILKSVKSSYKERQARVAGEQAAIAANLAKSEIARKAPKAVARMIELTTQEQGEPVTHLYVDPTRFIERAAEAGVNPEQAATELMGESGPKRLQQAVDMRNDSYGNRATLEVSVEQYLEKWGTRPFVEGLVSDTVALPGHATPREQVTYYQGEAKNLHDRLVREFGDTEVEDTSEFISAAEERFSEAMTQSLVDTGTVTRAQARDQVQVLVKGLHAISTNYGQDATKLFDQVMVNVRHMDDSVDGALPGMRGLTAKVKAMSDLDRSQSLWLDSNTGIYRPEGFAALKPDPKRPFVAHYSLEGIKWKNDESHDAGNDLYRLAGQLLAGIVDDATKWGGDFVSSVATVEEAQTNAQLLQANLAARLKELNPEIADALNGFEVSAVAKERGDDLTKVVETLQDEHTAIKKQREALGDRAARGATPFGIPVDDPKKLALPQERAEPRVVPDELMDKAAGFTEEQVFSQVFVNPTTGLLSREGFFALPKRKHVWSIDVDGLKALNEQEGRDTGDELIQTFAELGRIFGGAAVDYAHFSGDEFAIQSDDPDVGQYFIDILASGAQSVSYGGKPLTFGYARGSNFNEADARVPAFKRRARKFPAREARRRAKRAARRRSSDFPAGRDRLAGGARSPEIARSRRPSISADTRARAASERVIRRRVLKLRAEALRQSSPRDVAAKLLQVSNHEIAALAELTAEKVVRPKKPVKPPRVRSKRDAWDRVEAETFVTEASPTEQADHAYIKAVEGRGKMPGPYGGKDDGTFNSVDGLLGLEGKHRVKGGRHAFELLYASHEGTNSEKLVYAVEQMREVPGFEGIRVPDELIEEQAEEDLIAEQQRAAAEYYESQENNEFDADSESDVFYQTATIRSGEEVLGELDGRAKVLTRDVAIALENRQRKKYGRIERGDHSPEAAEKIANWMADELMFEMRPENVGTSAIGWYSSKYQSALDVFGEIHPELKTDQNARALFTAMVAITSDGQSPDVNFRQAAATYGDYRKTGRIEGASYRPAIGQNLKLLGDIVDKRGLQATVEWLLEEITYGDINAELRAQGKTTKSAFQAKTKVPRAAMMFGPKLGSFFANLMGSQGYLTMDRWWSRTFNRYRGALTREPTQQGLKRFRELIGKPNMSDEATIRATIGPRNSYKDKGFKNGTEIETAANTIHKAAFEELEDVPWGAKDRTFQIETAKLAQEKLKASGVSLTIADIQAALWYYEKRLYAELGARDSGSFSFEDIARDIVNEQRQPTSILGETERLREQLESSDTGVDVPKSAGGQLDRPGGPVPVGSSVDREGGLGEVLSPERDLRIEEELDLASSADSETFYQTDTPSSTESKEFKAWFKDSQVVDEDGEPLVVYHGTTANFTAFKREHANAESDLGAGFYATNNPVDVGVNYAGQGPDLTGKIQQEAERIASETDQDFDDPEVVAQARAKWIAHEGATMPLYMSMQNPVVLEQDGGTFLDFEFSMPEIAQKSETLYESDDGVKVELIDDEWVVTADNGGQDVGEFEDLDEAMDEARMAQEETGAFEETGKLVDFVVAFRELAEETAGSEYDIEQHQVDDVLGAITERAQDREGISAHELLELTKEHRSFNYMTDRETGALAGNEFVRRAFERAGFDGYIDRTVNEKFGTERKVGQSMVGVDEDTTHYVAFQPEQIKSATGNQGTYNPDSDNILFQDEDDPLASVEIVKKGNQRLYKVLLGEKSNMSSFLHESAHILFDVMGQLAGKENANERLVNDYDKILKWLGAERGGQLTVDQNEKFARGFELFLREGKAPSVGLVGAFTSFRRWLTQVYKSASTLRVEINDEIREVFGRMLATDGEIKRMEQAAGIDRPLWRSNIEANMSPAQWRDYLDQRAISSARVATDLQRRIHEAELRATEAFKSSEFKRFKREAEDEYLNRREIRAWRYLRTGEEKLADGRVIKNTETGKMDRDELRHIAGKKSALEKSLQGRLKKNGEHPGWVAERMGFDSGRQMVEMVASRPEKTKWVQERAESLMREHHPEIDGDIANLSQSVQELIHDDKNGKWLLAEYNELRRRVPKQDDPPGALADSGARAAAKDIANSQSIRRLNAGLSLQRERAAAHGAAVAVARGRFKEARDLKLKQMLERHLWREMVEAKKDRDKFLKFSGQMATTRRQETIGKAGVPYLSAVNSILEAMQLATPGHDPQRMALSEALSLIEEQQAAADFARDDLQALVIDPPASGWKDLTVEEMRTVNDSLKQLWVLARDQNSTVVDGQRMELDSLIDDIEAEAGARLPVEVGSQGIMSGIWHGLTEPQVELRRLGKTAYNATWVRYTKAQAHEDQLLREVGKYFAETWDNLPKEMQKSRTTLLEDFEGVEWPDDVDRQVVRDRQHMWMIALNMGNESNRERLLGGYGWDEQAVLDWLDRNMAKEEWEFVQATWDFLDKKLFPQVSETHRKARGVPTPKIPATPIQTQHGVFSGGYFPAKYDPVISRTGATQEFKVNQGAMGARPGAVSVSRTFTKPRAKNFSDVILLDWHVVPNHVMSVVHYVAFDEYVRQTNALMTHPRFKEMARRRLGDKPYRELADGGGSWLAFVASPGYQDLMPSQRDANAVMGYGKKMLVTSAIGWSIKTAMADIVDPMALTITSKETRVGATYLVGSMASVYTPGVHAIIEKRALTLGKEPLHRRENLRRKIRSQMDDIGGSKRRGKGSQLLNAVQDSAFFFLDFMDRKSTLIVWDSSFRQALSRGATEAEAALKADDTVQSAMPVQDIERKAALLRNPGFSQFVIFYGYFSKKFNQAAEVIDAAAQDWGHAEGFVDKLASSKDVAIAIAKVMAIVGIGQTFGEILSGRGPDEGEDDLEWFTRKMLAGPMMLFPVIGGVAEGLVNTGVSYAFHGENRHRPFNARSTALMSVLERLVQTAGRVTDDARAPDQRIWDTLELLGIPLLLPPGSAQFNRSRRYLQGEGGARGPEGIIYGPNEGKAQNVADIYRRVAE